MPNQKVNSAIHSEGEMNANIFKKYEKTGEKHLSSLTNVEVATHTGVWYSSRGGAHQKNINANIVNNPDSYLKHTGSKQQQF
jgi:hypothetical protein